jgi:hypothetical protein
MFRRKRQQNIKRKTAWAQRRQYGRRASTSSSGGTVKKELWNKGVIARSLHYEIRNRQAGIGVEQGPDLTSGRLSPMRTSTSSQVTGIAKI